MILEGVTRALLQFISQRGDGRVTLGVREFVWSVVAFRQPAEISYIAERA